MNSDVTADLTPTDAGTELRLRRGGLDIHPDLWANEAPVTMLPGLDRVRALVSADLAISDDTMVLLPHDAIAEFSARQAQSLGLPALSEAILRVETSGAATDARFRVNISWRRPTGQPIVGAKRLGALLTVGGVQQRLSASVFAIAKAADAAARAQGLEDRLIAIDRLREALPVAAREHKASLVGLPTQIDIVQADAFSLDLVGEGAQAQLVPILHRAGVMEPLLPPDQQDAFGHHQFQQFSDARPVYTLPGNVYLVLSPTLRRGLAEVRRHRLSPLTTKRAIFASPRAFLRAALEGDEDPTLVDLVEDLFVETQRYSDRVKGLGLWEKPSVPWIEKVPLDWLGTSNDSPDAAPPETLPGLTPQEAGPLRDRMAKALEAGEASITWQRPGKPDEPPVTLEVSRSLLAALDRKAKAAEARAGEKPDERVPLVIDNLDELGHEADFQHRRAIDQSVPSMLDATLKPHQSDGLKWLQQSWCAGVPGVLLADDMGLGKTLQGLAFLAWLREAMVRGELQSEPLLIVAPTGLLGNWLQEHSTFLSGSGLGEPLCAFGPGLRGLRKHGGVELDIEKLRAAPWVLTTYETLRDHSRDFGAVRFAALLADEAQKVKTPDARMTAMFKAMNADFRIAMTGTPVENRLADLWCIVDGVRSGWLGTLKHFSQTYETKSDEASLAPMVRKVRDPFGKIPALMLRRMKEDHLPDLSEATTHVHTAPMGAQQREAYLAARAAARGGDGTRTSILAALHRFREVSLHPEPEMTGDEASFIAASARLVQAFIVLDGIAATGERALIFLRDTRLQPRLTSLIQRRYNLPAPPEIINGAVAGHRRQERVNRFQHAPEGFDVMILSPLAAGVGLTITRANHVIHLERWWNPAVEDQCTARALRIGQTRNVHVHLPIATLGGADRSFDENLHALLERKRQLTRLAMLPPEPSAGEAEALLRDTLAG